jgi:hypothetical protein
VTVDATLFLVKSVRSAKNVIEERVTAMQTQHIDYPPTTENRAKRRVFITRKAVLAASAALCIAVSLCSWWQPDWLAPVALVPALYWLVVGLGLTAFGMSRKHRRWSFAVLALWLVYAAAMVEEIESLACSRNWPTAAWKAARTDGRAIRVVSLNCAEK